MKLNNALGFSLFDWFMAFIFLTILGVLLAPLAYGEDQKILDLQKYLAESTKIDNSMPPGFTANSYPFVLPRADRQVPVQKIEISPNPLLLREQIISERVGPNPGVWDRAFQGAIVDAEMGRRR